MYMSNRWTYLGDGCSEDNDFVQLAHSLHEFVDSRSLNDIYIMIIAFNFDRYSEIRLVENLGIKYQHEIKRSRSLCNCTYLE